jgi:hypothetical protein
MATILKFRKMHEVIKKYRTNEKIKLSKSIEYDRNYR